MDANLRGELQRLIKGELRDDKASRLAFSRDASIFEVSPDGIVAPTNASDVCRLVLFAGRHRDRGISLTARSGGTDMTGGPLNSSLIIDFTQHFNRIKEIDGDRAVVEPGVYYRDFEKGTLKQNRFLPSYPASREICTVGGMVANNAGGEKTLAYGKTEDYVESLKVVLRDGHEYALGPLSQREVEQKMKQDDFEGEVYRSVSKLLVEHHDQIERARPQVSKNSAGYALWNIWNGDQFNLAKLFVGSQGTLGLITEITFRLIQPKPQSVLLVIFLHNLTSLVPTIKEVLHHEPESFEAFDDHTLRLGIRYFFFRFALQFIPELGIVLRHGFPKLVLLAEFTGDSREEALMKAHAAQNTLTLMNIPTRITRDARDTEKYWTVRRESFNLLRTRIRGRRTAPFIEDIIVRPENLAEFLPQLEALLNEYHLTYTIAGHAGDGNFHIIPLMDLSRPDTKTVITELSEKVYNLVVSYQGSITAEHNDGLIRSPYLEKMYGSEVCALFAKVKNIFDPDNIFNPGKKVGASWQYALDHVQTS